MTEADRRLTRLIVEPTQDGRGIVGVWDITSLTPERLAELRQWHEREFVYARDYDALLAEVAALRAEIAILTSDLETSRDARDTATAHFLAVSDERDELKQQLSAAEHAREEGRWQPIDSAPQDGTNVLLWWPFWCPNRPTIGWFGFKGIQQWVAPEVLEGDGDPPTHWMPLPTKPAALRAVSAEGAAESK